MPKKASLPHRDHSSAPRSPSNPNFTEADHLRKQLATTIQRLQATPDVPVSVQEVMVLQRTLGNHAVQRLLKSTSPVPSPVIQRGKINKELRKRLNRSYLRNRFGKAIPRSHRYLYSRQGRHSYGFTHTKIKAGFLRGRFRKGWGSQPFLYLNKKHYKGSTVKSDYDSIWREIQKIKGPKWKVARDILNFIESGDIDKEKYKGNARRAISTLIQLTQFIESHKSRVPGADKLARASLRRIANGESTFKDEFNRESGNYLPARAKTAGSSVSGQEATRAAFGAPPKKSDKATYKKVVNKEVEKTLGELSDSSDEEYSESED